MYKNDIALFATISKAKTITTEKYASPRLIMRMGDKYYAISNATAGRCVLTKKKPGNIDYGDALGKIGSANDYQNVCQLFKSTS